MLKSRIIIALSSLALGAVLAIGCQRGGAPPGAQAPRLAYSTASLANVFWQRVTDGVRQGAEKAGAELLVVDAQGDARKQLSDIEDLVQQDVDAILISPYQSDPIVPAVRAANEAKVPVVIVDIGVKGGEYVALIISDNEAGGRLAGEFIAERIGAKGPVAHISAQPGVENARKRGQGFADVMKQRGIEVAASQTAYSERAKGMEVMENMLQAHPDIRAVFCENDEMALGATRALAGAGRKDVVVVGFDGNADALEAIREGDLAATVAQQPEEMGRMGVRIALSTLRGEPVEKTVQVPVKLITRDNLAEFLPKEASR
ncbi:MAG: substrate-binding domain-containing protein [Armatimonadota bacterium]|nr:MAG: substrate-binding domain-containing protein [Armatimonadota bacterium]